MTSDVKIRVEATGLSTFPEVSDVCGPLERAPNDQNSIANPKILVEILSPSTEEYDRGEKRRHYQLFASLQCVLLVSHDTRRVTVVSRTEAGQRQQTDHTDRFDVPDVGSLSIDDVYG